MKTWRIVQYIYEGTETEPTLMHVFLGETREQAEGVYAAHMTTDSFMRNCVTAGRFRDFACHVANQTEQLVNGHWTVVATTRRPHG